MSVPDYQSFMRPLLAYAQDGSEKNIGEAIKLLADEFGLSDDDRAQMLPSGKQTLLANRVHWALTYLAKAGALTRTRRSHFVITERGKALLQEHPDRVTVKVLNQFPEFVVFQSGKPTEDGVAGGEQVNHQPPTSRSNASLANASTPDEAIQDAQEIIAERLKSDLLDRIAALSPTFFEQLVVDLVVAMGYGGSRGAVAHRLGKSGDGGIDGIVNEDVLGLDVVYLQAKKYSPDNTVGRPAIQQFAGALVGHGANRGVFITTSTYSSGAIQFAQQVPQKIILIDGNRLTELMIQFDVGVRVERAVLIKRIDLDYFEEVEQ